MIITFNTNGNDKQKLVCKHWVDVLTTDIAYGGSKGSGKSYLGCSLIFGDAFIYPGTHYFIARKSLTAIRKFTIPSIHEVFKHWGITDQDYKYNGQDNFYELNNGSKVYLLDAKFIPSDPEYYRFGSMQMTRGWIEEAGEFEEECKNNLAASIGRWRNDEYSLHPKLLQTCNPSKNYLYRDYYKKSKERTLEAWKCFIQALPTDNKMLPASYLENLNNILTKNQKERLLFGNWEYDDDPSVLMDYNKIVDIFNNNHVKEGDKYITSDLARLGGDRIVIIEWNGFRGYVKWAKKQTLDITTRSIEQSRNKLMIGLSDVLVDEDGLGGGVVDFYKCKGFVNNSRPMENPEAGRDQKGNRIPENFDNLKSQCYFRLADKVNKNELFLECEDDSIKDLIIEELEQIKQKNMDSDLKKGVIPKDKIKEVLGRSPDFADTIMMRMWFELRIKRDVFFF